MTLAQFESLCPNSQSENCPIYGGAVSMVTQVQGTPDLLSFLLQHQALLCPFWRWHYVLGPHFLQEVSEKDRD